ncbi:MAG: ChbG/HpnK family deacetylase [Verrucomicrobiia bacterium]
MSIALIPRADDAALSVGTNLAIRDCVLAGQVCNVGLMACGPALNHAAEVLQPLADRCAFGVHATTTSEFQHPRLRPLLAESMTSALAQTDGSFFPNVVDWHENVAIGRVIDEVRAQIAEVRLAGFAPVYLDTHMGFHWVPGVEEALVELARQEGLIWADDAGRFPKLSPEFLNETSSPTSSPHVLVFHPAYADSDCPSLILCGAGKDLLPQRTEEARSLLNGSLASLLRSCGTTYRFDDAV